VANFDELELLIENNNYQQLEKEIELDGDLVFLVDKNGSTLLMRAAACRGCECTLVLMQAGSDVNAKNYYGQTALMNAAWSNFKNAEYLIQRGADLSFRDNFGNSTLDLALSRKRESYHGWFELFTLHQNQFDEKDLARYHELRLSILFETIKN
jgi:ankyrin repeat protein